MCKPAGAGDRDGCRWNYMEKRGSKPAVPPPGDKPGSRAKVSSSLAVTVSASRRGINATGAKEELPRQEPAAVADADGITSCRGFKSRRVHHSYGPVAQRTEQSFIPTCRHGLRFLLRGCHFKSSQPNQFGNSQELFMDATQMAYNNAKSFLLAAQKLSKLEATPSGEVVFLLVPCMVNTAFSLELSLKEICLSETGKRSREHDIDKLINMISSQSRDNLYLGVKNKLGDKGVCINDAEIAKVIKENANAFISWRYMHEKLSENMIAHIGVLLPLAQSAVELLDLKYLSK
jgi:hypothetical protein